MGGTGVGVGSSPPQAANTNTALTMSANTDASLLITVLQSLVNEPETYDAAPYQAA